ncbi:MAG: hypothetical protein ATN33_02925 [Epulopiscium sp. Nele67-Bin001]|nr:MAG: hypothetical protein BEN18_05715 [Epulopiscium sp. Nuni2H_MBin001]OON90496.1 MAG: hypothetical protein ATN33_02925 [Epulopiscium sp. Nele67-Bin001]
MLTAFFGAIFNIIFEGMALLTHIGTLGFAIIVFTLVTRLLMTPLQIKQQRSTRMMSKLQPEMKAIQDKYVNRKDQQSQMQQSQEMQALYKKYNVNPFAGCLPLLIQLPLIYALYAVLRQPSKYITKLAELYSLIASTIEATVSDIGIKLTALIAEYPMSSTAQLELSKIDIPSTADYISNFTTQQWAALMEVAPELNGVLTQLLQQKSDYEYFLFNLVDAPSQLVSSGNYLAFIVPILAGASTFIFSKITMAQSRPTPSPDAQENPAESVAKTMNIMMPIMMGFFSYTVPSGLALYWIAGNLIMMGQQIWVGRLVAKEMTALDEQLERERAERTGPKKKRKKRPPQEGGATNSGQVSVNGSNGSGAEKVRKERKQPGK